MSKPRLVLVLLACASTALVGCGPASSPPSGGPLVGPSGLTLTAAPRSGPVWVSLDLCVAAEVDELDLRSVAPVAPWGEGDVEVLVDWPSEPESTGLAGGRPPARYVPVGQDPQGRPARCGEGPASPVLALAVPAADGQDVGFDDLEVVYVADGEEHTVTMTVSIGLCAAGDPDPMPSCAEG